MNMYKRVGLFVLNFDTRDYKHTKIFYETFLTVSNDNHDDGSLASNNFLIGYF